MTSDETISESDISEETMVRESKEMLQEQKASRLFDLLLEMRHLHVLIVSHKG
jgi:hypothetical protein